jgi:hypothetical protein
MASLVENSLCIGSWPILYVRIHLVGWAGMDAV